MQATPVPPTPEAQCFIGGPASGKTAMLVQHARELLEAGAAEADVLVLAAAPVCADLLREELPGVDVLTAREFALHVLAAPEARAFTGRPARVLTRAEERFLEEDMQVSTLKRRLRRSLDRYIQGGWSMLYDEDPEWLLGEEQAYADMLLDVLRFEQGMLAAEVSMLAVRFLQHGGHPERFQRAHVLVDDYTALSRASQVLANMVARDSICIAGDDAPLPQVYEQFPHAPGIEEFCQANPHAHVERMTRCALPMQVRSVVNRLRENECIGAKACDDPSGTAAEGGGQGDVEVRMLPNVAKELDAIVGLVRDALEAGVPAQRVLVTCVNGTWRANLARSLERVGIPVSRPERAATLRGDLRDGRVCEKARREVLLRLAENPADGPAWRSWLGFGDYLGRSAELARLRAGANGRTLVEAFDALEAGAGTGADGGAAGDDARFDPLVTLRQQGEDEATCLRTGQERAGGGAGNDAAAEGVRVAAPADAFGHSYDLVVFGGFVNGFMPSRAWFDESALTGNARTYARENDVRLLHLVAVTARGRLVFTGFERATLELAEQLGLRIKRIRAQEGQRICQLEPSIYLEAMGL